MSEKTTDELFNEIKADADIENFIAANQAEFTGKFHEYLRQLLREKNLTVRDIADALNLDRSYVHHIFSGAKKTSRGRLLAIARVMRLDLQATQYLLRYGGFAILYPRIPWDAVVISAIEHDMTFAEMNDYLNQLGELPIVK